MICARAYDSATCSLGLKGEVIDFLKRLGAFKVEVANPRFGFDKALKVCHPKDMKNCNSVIAFAFNVGLDHFVSFRMTHESPRMRIPRLYGTWAALQLISFLRRKGYEGMVVEGFVDGVLSKDSQKWIPYLSSKLAAYEAGIGVFGRPSLLITPEYGPRVNVFHVLTNAVLEPNGRVTNFIPCEKCDTCVELCPVKAINVNLPPPTGFDREKCVQFNRWLHSPLSYLSISPLLYLPSCTWVLLL